jgi:uncharacterized spore protein YtfJ
MDTQNPVNTAPIEQLMERIGVDSVFGAPTKEGDVTIIPVADVSFGFGYGGGTGPEEDEARSATAETVGQGSGAGAGGRTTPRGYIRITPEGVSFEPIVETTRIPLAGMLMGAWTIFWITATIRTIAKAVARVKK